MYISKMYFQNIYGNIFPKYTTLLNTSFDIFLEKIFHKKRYLNNF